MFELFAKVGKILPAGKHQRGIYVSFIWSIKE